MSATNRAQERSRRLAANPLDFYETPHDAVEVLLTVLREEISLDESPTIIDAGCGTGVIGLAVQFEFGCNVVGVELDLGRQQEALRRGLDVWQEDFLASTEDIRTLAPQQVDHVVGNPPYHVAVPFVHKALDVVAEGGLVSFLLRLNFLGSGRKRYDLLAPGRGLYRVDVLTDRPSFCTTTKCKACGQTWQFAAGVPLREARHPEGHPACEHSGNPPKVGTPYTASRTDSVDYAWVTWCKGYTGHARIDIQPSRKGTP